VLTTFVTQASKPEKGHRQDACATYNFKRQCIEHSLYGVDIDPGAVEIAKLRLWLSLVVDEQDINNIKPLPNLDYRIMQGNSLISEFMGISFDSDKEKSGENLMFKDETDELIEQFQQKKDEFLNESNVSRKSKMKEEIDDLIIEIFETKLKIQKANYFNKLKNIENKYSELPNGKQRDELIKQDKEKLYKESGFDLEAAEKQLKESTSGKRIKPFFLWNLYFSEVFHNKGGFDVVIANPPYVQIKQIPWDDRKVFVKKFKSAVGRFNLFYFFLEISSNILRPSGFSTYIVPDRLLLNTQCDKLRKWLLQEQTILEIDSFIKGVFQAVVDNIIIFYCNNRSQKNNIRAKNNVDIENIENISAFEIPITYFFNSPSNQFDLSYDPKIANLINKIKSNSLSLEKISETKDGIIQSKIGKELFLNKRIDEDSKKLLFGKDIVKYKISFRNNWVNYKPNEMMKLELKRVKGAPGLRLRTPVIFGRNKILTRQTADEIIAAYDTDCYYYSNTLHGTTITNEKYNPLFVLALLNSKLITWYYRRTTAEEGKVFAQIKIGLLRKLPVKETSDTEQRCIIKIVEHIISITQSDDYLQNPQKQAKVKALEEEIDQLVYKLYNLTPEEIKIVEGKHEDAD
jgi:hypothetical protein